MSENNSPDTRQQNQDYQYALEAIFNASETVLQDLGREIIEQAGSITFDSGVSAPKRIVEHAERLTHYAGVVEPEQTIAEAESITAHDAEVASVGEDLGEDEELLEGGVAYEASLVLRDEEIRTAYADPDNKRAAYKYHLSKAKTEAEVQEVKQKYKEI